MSATPAPTASKVSNGRTSAPDGNTSILMRPPVATPTISANLTALAWRPGVSSGQSVTIFSCRIPCAIAGDGKRTVAPVASDPAPARISRRLMAPPFLPGDVPAPGQVVADNIRPEVYRNNLHKSLLVCRSATEPRVPVDSDGIRSEQGSRFDG